MAPDDTSTREATQTGAPSAPSVDNASLYIHAAVVVIVVVAVTVLTALGKLTAAQTIGILGVALGFAGANVTSAAMSR
ncbi:MAG: hypothetical protein ABSB73_09185 [Solirubrobacteraceae bacterium]|jgi:hypothetical protein